MFNFGRKFFCTTKKSSLLRFHSRLEAHKSKLTAFNIEDQDLAILSEKEHEVHSLSSSFFIYPSEFQVFKHKDSFELNSEKKPFNHLRANFHRFLLPLSYHNELRNRFMRFYTGQVRLGRLMEVLDYMAAVTAYGHCYCKTFSRDISIVTVCMDHFNIFKPLSVNEDIVIQSYPTCTTNSTVEIRIDVYQKDKENKFNDLCSSALFLMAARDPSDFGKSAALPKLIFDGETDLENCLLREDIAKKTNGERKKNSESSAFKVPPTGIESIELHGIFMGIKKGVPMISTQITKTLLMHQQERNISGRVFGGYLMKEAMELAWNCVYVFTKTFPEYFIVDDVKFLKGVEVGSVVDFKATITGIFGQLIHVVVITKVHDAVEYTNELHITLRVPEGTEIAPIYPERYDEGMMYLEAKRRLHRSIGIQY